MFIDCPKQMADIFLFVFLQAEGVIFSHNVVSVPDMSEVLAMQVRVL